MLKQYHLYLIINILFAVRIDALTPINVYSDQGTKGYRLLENITHVLVHLTDVYPGDQMTVGVRDFPWVLPPGMTMPPSRATIHWRLDGPADYGSVGRYVGSEFVAEDLSHRHFGVLVPLTAVDDQVYGGFARDLFTVGEIQLPDTAVLFAKKTVYDKIKNKTFPGEVVVFDHKSNVTDEIISYLEKQANMAYAQEDGLIPVDEFLQDLEGTSAILAKKLNITDPGEMDRFMSSVRLIGARLGEIYEDWYIQSSSRKKNLQQYLDDTLNAPALSKGKEPYYEITQEQPGKKGLFVRISLIMSQWYGSRSLTYWEYRVNEKEFLTHVLNLYDAPELMLSHDESVFRRIEESLKTLAYFPDRQTEICHQLRLASGHIEHMSNDIQRTFRSWYEDVLAWMSDHTEHSSCAIQ